MGLKVEGRDRRKREGLRVYPLQVTTIQDSSNSSCFDSVFLYSNFEKSYLKEVA